MPKFSDLLPSLLEGFTGQVAEQQKQKRESRLKVDELLQLELLKLARQSQPTPQPQGGFSQAEFEQLGPQGIQQYQQAFETMAKQRNQPVQNQMDMLLRVMGKTPSAGVNVFAFDPATGNVQPALGGQTLPPGSRVLPTRATPEEVRGVSEERAAGKAAGTPLSPQQSSLVQNFVELDKSMSTIDTLLEADPGFKGQLFATGLPFQPGAGQLADELLNSADILLRMRSGAQINEKEFARLRGLLPRSRTALSELLGNPGRARQQVVRFKNAAREILDSKRTQLDFQGTPSGSTGASSKVESLLQRNGL